MEDVECRKAASRVCRLSAGLFNERLMKSWNLQVRISSLCNLINELVSLKMPEYLVPTLAPASLNTS